MTSTLTTFFLNHAQCLSDKKRNLFLFFGKTSKYSRDPNKTGENLFWIFFLSKAE